MCGICGFVHRERRPAEPGVLASMLGTLVHRGPDDAGTFVEGPVALGMRRLAIIDVAGGRQPMTNESGDVVLVFNGEIYDYRERAAELRSRGHQLRTDSDTEVIVHLYEEHGDDCVEHLRGMFGFALWDRSRRRLLLARDRMGIKPLYYTFTADGIAFGSEIKALLRHPGVTARLDPEALGLYLSLKYVPAPHTFFDGVHALEPGHTLVWDDSGARVRKYWDLSFRGAEEPSGDDEVATVDELLDVLSTAVDLHLRADVPFGAFLSGGLDSSLVVALMSRALAAPVRTFALGFERTAGARSELPFARTVAEAFGTEHFEVLTGPDDFIADAERVIWHLDQPIADQATVATYRLAAAARAEVKMVLTGEGGDELFAGYARYAAERWSPAFRALPSALRPAVWGAAQRLPRLRRAKIALYALLQSGESARFANWFPLFNDTDRQRVLSPELRRATLPDGAARLFGEHLARAGTTDPVQRMLYVDSKTWLPDFLLLRGDKLTMAASLEARVPLLDHVVAEFAAARPARDKVRDGRGKYLLKQAARRLLPAEIVDRPKQGFPVPISDWFRGPARDFVHDLLDPSTLRRRGLFDSTEVARLLADHDRGRADHGPLLWGLASVELWHRAFVDAPPSAAHDPPTPGDTRTSPSHAALPHAFPSSYGRPQEEADQ